jgi:hypothetical protein
MRDTARVLLALAVALAMVVSLGACKKKEEKPITQVMPGQTMPGQTMPGQTMPGQAPTAQMPQGGSPHGAVTPTGETQIVVPEDVKSTWTAVKLSIEDKGTGKAEEVTIKVGDSYTIPGSELKIIVGEFFPHFQMKGSVITSASNEPVMPGVAIRVMEGGSQIFPQAGKEWGWLFSKMPAIHPFQHQKYGISLVEGVKKG